MGNTAGTHSAPCLACTRDKLRKCQFDFTSSIFPPKHQHHSRLWHSRSQPQLWRPFQETPSRLGIPTQVPRPLLPLRECRSPSSLKMVTSPGERKGWIAEALPLPQLKATASAHMASLICFLSLIFFLIGRSPPATFSLASYRIFGASNKSILFGARRGPGQSHFKGMQSGSVSLIVLPCECPPSCPEPP
jgi:hypothetical protein